MVLLSNVQYGKTNADVTTVQTALINRGYSIPAGATGYFGDQTKAAYTQFEINEMGYSSSTGSANSPTFGAIAKSSVQYSLNSGITNSQSVFQGYAFTACDKTGVPRDWVTGHAGCSLTTLAVRESSFDDNAVNTTDSNATGAIVADGHPENCSRGYCQTIPATFAAYHEETTSNRIYDPVANIAAAINYIRARYGSIENVQQANPNLPPKGY